MGSLKQRRGTNYILAGDFIDGPHFLIVEKESNCFSSSASEFRVSTTTVSELQIKNRWAMTLFTENFSNFKRDWNNIAPSIICHFREILSLAPRANASAFSWKNYPICDLCIWIDNYQNCRSENQEFFSFHACYHVDIFVGDGVGVVIRTQNY